MADGAREDPVAGYKNIFRQVLDSRPSGTRQRLAEALGKNRSFISQIAGPAYPTPIPARHIEQIFEVCHFSPQEREQFLDAYRAAHPRRLEASAATGDHRVLRIEVHDFGDEELNRAFDRLLRDAATRIGRLIESSRNG